MVTLRLLGAVSAGEGAIQWERLDDEVSVPAEVCGGSATGCAAVKVLGDSMPESAPDGSTCIFRTKKPGKVGQFFGSRRMNTDGRVKLGFRQA